MFEFAGERYESEEAFLDALKLDDHYHFSIPFEFIEARHGDGDYDISEAMMEVDVDWSSSEHGYSVSYSCPDMYRIDPSQGNSDVHEVYESQVEERVLEELDGLGIGSISLVGGTGTF